MVILQAVIETIEICCDNLTKLNINYQEIVALGITNQRETTILWDCVSGKPLYNAIGKFLFFMLMLYGQLILLKTKKIVFHIVEQLLEKLTKHLCFI